MKIEFDVTDNHTTLIINNNFDNKEEAKIIETWYKQIVNYLKNLKFEEAKK